MNDILALILTGGDPPPQKLSNRYIKRAEKVVAADSGFDQALKLSYMPDLVVGDMDSVVHTAELNDFPPERKKIWPREKDETDTELALRLLWQEGFREIAVLGGGGGRLDHTIGILSLFEREIHPTVWLTDREMVVLVEDSFSIRTCIGEIVSVFTVGGQAAGLRSEGLKWSLNGLTWTRGDMGVSNETVAEEIFLEVKKGKILVILELRGDRMHV